MDHPTSTRRRLGRGLDALLGGASAPEPAGDETGGDRLTQIPVKAITRNPFQPRRDFDEASLAELSASIRRHGVLQPLLVRPHGDGYQLIAGERRWLAAQRAGLETVPCVVQERDDRSVCEAALEENLKRQDLHVLEKAQAFRDYLDRFGGTIEELAGTLSLDRSTVSNMLRLLELPASVQQYLRQDAIKAGHARAMLALDEEAQLALCRRIQREGLSVRAAERAVRELLKPREEAPAAVPRDDARQTEHVRSLEQRLAELLGARVSIRVTGTDRGRIVIEFQSNDDFQRLVELFRRAA